MYSAASLISEERVPRRPVADSFTPKARASVRNPLSEQMMRPRTTTQFDILELGPKRDLDRI
jgi:hypothetical protein